MKFSHFEKGAGPPEGLEKGIFSKISIFHLSLTLCILHNQSLWGLKISITYVKSHNGSLEIKKIEI